MNNAALDAGDRVMQAVYEDGLLQSIQTLDLDLWQNNSHLTLFIPKGEEEKTRIFSWDEKLTPIWTE